MLKVLQLAITIVLYSLSVSAFVRFDIRDTFVYKVNCKGTRKDSACRFTREPLRGTNEAKRCDVIFDGNIRKFQAVNEDSVAVTINPLSSGPDPDPIHAGVINTTFINLTSCDYKQLVYSPNFNVTPPSFEHSYADYIRNIDSFKSTIKNDDGTIDTFYFNVRSCNATLCRLTFDENGKFIRKGVFFNNTDQSDVVALYKLDWANETYVTIEASKMDDEEVTEPGPPRIVRRFEIDGNEWYPIKKSEDQRVRFSIIKTNGSQTILADYPPTLCSVSVANHNIRICRKIADNSSIINCTVFDIDGNEVSQSSIELNHKISHVHVENLKNGKFILLTSNTYDLDNMFATKIGVDGKYIGTFEFTTPLGRCVEFDRKITPTLETSFAIVNNQYCHFSVCHGIKKWSESSTQCFVDADFK